MTLTEAVQREHRALLRGIERIRQAGDQVGETDPKVWSEKVNGVLDFVDHELLPHIHEEEALLNPELSRIVPPDMIRIIAKDHAEIAELSHQLARATEEQDVRMVRRLLYGMYHVIRLHLAKEEEIYVPLLDRELTPERVGRLVAALGAK